MKRIRAAKNLPETGRFSVRDPADHLVTAAMLKKCSIRVGRMEMPEEE